MKKTNRKKEITKTDYRIPPYGSFVLRESMAGARRCIDAFGPSGKFLDTTPQLAATTHVELCQAIVEGDTKRALSLACYITELVGLMAYAAKAAARTGHAEGGATVPANAEPAPPQEEQTNLPDSSQPRS
jgi:hypothetical protein